MRYLAVTLLTVTLALTSTVGALGQEGTTMPRVPVGPDVSYFVGTQECRWGHSGTGLIDGVRRYAEHFSCVTETTDPRVTGTEELAIVTHGDYGVASPWTVEAVFSTEDGSWRGSGRGMVDYRGASPLGTPGRPFNYGEMTYIGEGANEGLVIHHYIAGTNDALALSGWVAPAE